MGQLLALLDKEALERVVVQSIIEHRRLLDIAETTFEAMNADKGDGTAAREAYVCAMLNSKVQTEVVALLLDKLGYVPEVQAETSSDD
ncbi:MAG: hypothetical protein ABS76_37140 [Pelagibacterium sp. SCN 64-44]|nr:MAG: hypothetical protein ABS76_37140 [Pelagibacterium sp. SCN 64-44]